MPNWDRWPHRDKDEEHFLTSHDFNWVNADEGNPSTDTGALLEAIRDAARDIARDTFRSAGVLRIRGSKRNC
jgi:hypothetical protein